jgi:capsular exopolysaccharide synthesis family protein
MTRLTEALERAQASPQATPPAEPSSSQDPRDVPVDWQFQDVDTSQGRRLTPSPAARAGAVVPEVPAQPAAPARHAPVVATPPDVHADKLVIGQHDGLLIEQFRRLAAVLHHEQLQRQAHTVMIASAVPSEGKSLTASNLALTLSRSYEKRVLLIDTDLRRPSLHTLFNVSNSIGLTTTLNDPQQGRLPVVQVHQNLWLLPAGRPDPNPTSLVTSVAMKQLIEEASAQFDWVILDTPPVGLMPDANLLAAMVDTAFVVVNAGETPYPLVKKAVEAIGLERVLGVVLNRADRSAAAGAYSYGYYDYHTHEAPKAPTGHNCLALS